MRIRSFYLGRLRCSLVSSSTDDPVALPFWFPIAQSDAVDSFLRGVDGNLRQVIIDRAMETLEAIDGVSKDIIPKFASALKQRIDEYLYTRFEGQMDSTVKILSIGSLTKFADMLVQMQSLRSASLEGEATVGGMIESLSITRTGGCRWHHQIGLDTHNFEDSTHVFT
jgi:hypothetical protein